MSGERKGSPLLSTLCHSHDFLRQLLQSITQLGWLAHNHGTIQTGQKVCYPTEVPNITTQHDPLRHLLERSQRGRHHLLRLL